MELTLDILLYFISDLHPECVNRSADPGLFVGVKEFFAGMEPDGEDDARYLYVAAWEELQNGLDALTPDMTVLVAREEETDKLPDGPCTWILVDKRCPLPYLLNRMIEVFGRMTNCDKNMNIATLEGKNVQVLLDLCEDLLGHPTIIFDSGFDVLAYTKNIPCDYKPFQETVKNGYTDSETMKRIRDNRIFSGLKAGEPLVAPAAADETQTNIYLSFSGDQTLLGYACVHFAHESPNRGYLELLQMIMDNIGFCLRRHFESSHYGQMMHETFLLNLMNPSGISEEQAAEQIENIGNLSLTGRFVLAVFEFPKEENAPLPFLTRILDREMWDVKPFIYDGQICLLKTLEDSREADHFLTHWEKENIVRLLGEREFSVGISNAFYDLTDLPYAFLQAKAALSFRDPKERYCLYGDVCYDHLLSLLEREMPAQSLQPEFYTQMKAYDREHRTENLKIILTYLECDCNATHAAEQLFLHRNTVRNAVLFVEERWGISLSDTEIKKKLVLSDLVDRYLN